MEKFTVKYLDGDKYVDLMPGLTWDYEKCQLIASSAWNIRNMRIEPEMMRIYKIKGGKESGEKQEDERVVEKSSNETGRGKS